MTTIIDAHVEIGHSLQGWQRSLDEALFDMDRLKIERALLTPVRPIDYHYAAENERVASAVCQHPGRFWGLGRVDPRRPDSVTEARRCLGELGLRGMYLHPWEDCLPITDARVEGVIEAVQTAHGIVMIAAGYPWVSDPLQVLAVARRWSQTPMIMTNGGQLNISGGGQLNARVALEEQANLYITSAGVYRQDFLEEIVTQVGGERLLFASHSPHFDAEYELQRVQWLHVAEAQKEGVLGANLLRVLV